MEQTKQLKQAWEYLTKERTTGLCERQMDELGRDGWELVGFQINGHDVVEVYKRPK